MKKILALSVTSRANNIIAPIEMYVETLNPHIVQYRLYLSQICIFKLKILQYTGTHSISHI